MEEDTYLRAIFLELPASSIVYLKFILESYEGIAEVRTLDADTALLAILAIKDTEAQVRKIIDFHQEELQAKYVDRPSSLDGDWLLGSIAKESTS